MARGRHLGERLQPRPDLEHRPQPPHGRSPQAFDPSGAAGVSEKNVEQGAATSTPLAASPLVEGVTGVYFEDCQQAEPFVAGVRRGVADYAVDPVAAERLWTITCDLLAKAGYPVATAVMPGWAA